MRGAARGLALVVFAVAPLGSGFAAGSKPPPLPPTPPAAPSTALPPYQNDIERLAEVMGTLAFMRDLCGPAAGADWRDKMASLLATEGTTDQRRARLAGRFNRGYDGYRLTYRTCTPAADAVIARSLADGERLSTALSRSFSEE